MTPDNLRWDRMARGMARLLLVTAVAMQVVFVAGFWGKTWDDGAITMAYARTFAQTGRVELTPGSGVVEGFSTPGWMLLLSGVARIAPDPATLLAVAKGLTCALGVLNVLLVWRVLRAWGEGVAVAELTAGVFGLLELTLFEAINAMETPLMLTLMLLAVLFLPRGGRGRPVLFMVCGCLFVLMRFEAFLLMLPLLAFVEPRGRRLLVATAGFLVIAIEELERKRFFGQWLPNTIAAKRHVPYVAATAALELRRHLLPVMTLGRGLAMLVIALGVGCWLGRKALRVRLGVEFWRGDAVRIAGALAGVGILLDLAVGQNWGPPDREMFAVMPFLVYLLVRAAIAAAGDARARAIVCGTLVVLAGYRTVRSAQRLGEAASPLYMPRITVGTVAALDGPVQRIRAAAGLPALTFATPDVGGTALFGDGIRVMDLGLLCDRRLARDGYGVAEQYIFDERRPEVMEVHNFWTGLTGMDSTGRLAEGYVAMIIEGKRFFVRKDVFARIADQTQTRPFTAAGEAQAADTGNRLSYPDYSAVDDAVNRKMATYAVFAR